MSERPDFDALLWAHDGWRVDRLGDCWRCQCGDSLRDFWPAGGVTPQDSALNAAHRAHLAAALNAEVDRWLTDEGTRAAVERAVFAHVCNVSNLPEWMRVAALGRGMRPLVDPIVATALAALTTPAEPNEEA